MESMSPKAQIIAVAVGLVVLALGVLRYRRHAAACPRHSRWAAGVAVLLAWGALGVSSILLLIALLVPLGAPPALPLESEQLRSATTSLPVEPSVAEEIADDPQPEIVGVWTDNYQGKRTMTLRDDGTGTMEVELSGVTAKLFAKRLQFDMLWSMENGKLIKESIGGQPSEKVELILRTMGRRVEESILELTRDRLRTLDPDGVTTYVWTRIP